MEREYNLMTAISIVGTGIIAFISIRILLEYVCDVGLFKNNAICILENGFDTEFTNVDGEFDSHDYDALS